MNTRLIFLISFLVVSLGLLALYQNINARAEAKAKQALAAAGQQTKTFVTWQAKQPLFRGTKVSKNDFERVVLEEPQANKLGVYSDVILPLEKDTLANRDIEQGAWVFSEQLSNPDDGGYLELLATEGMILYPLPISTSNMINHYIRPGDYVDIVSVSSPTINLANQGTKITEFLGVEARTIMRKVKVLAFESPSLGDDDKKKKKDTMPSSNTTISPRTSAANSDQTMVVIEVEPDFVSKLSLAQRTMHLEIYRSQPDGLIPTANMGDVMDNYQGIRELRGTDALAVNQIEVY